MKNKWYKRAGIALNDFYRSFLFVAVVALCPIILLVGILVSDYNTRQIGFADHPPAIYYIYDDDGLTITIMGADLSVGRETLDTARRAGDNLVSFVPGSVRLYAAAAIYLGDLLRQIFYKAVEFL